jgi:hypothetical protein
MPTYDLVRSEEWSAYRMSMPTDDSIIRAFNDAIWGTVARYGRWVMPRPRIVRKVTPPVVGAIKTTGLNLIEWNDDPSLGRNNLLELQRSLLKSQLLGKLDNYTGASPTDSWSEPRVERYQPALHGAFTTWQSGQAAVTQSEEDDVPSVLSPSEHTEPRPQAEDNTALWVAGAAAAGAGLALIGALWISANAGGRGRVVVVGQGGRETRYNGKRRRMR